MQLVIFIGIQASGKSTFYKSNFFNTHVRLSMDLLNTRNKENQFLETCLRTHSRFVVDNTNPTIDDRKRYIDLAKANKYEVVGYYFSSAIKEALRRNSLRIGKEKIPDAGILSCYSKLEMPSADEGFDKLYFVRAIDQDFIVDDWKNEI